MSCHLLSHNMEITHTHALHFKLMDFCSSCEGKNYLSCFTESYFKKLQDISCDSVEHDTRRYLIREEVISVLDEFIIPLVVFPCKCVSAAVHFYYLYLPMGKLVLLFFHVNSDLAALCFSYSDRRNSES